MTDATPLIYRPARTTPRRPWLAMTFAVAGLATAGVSSAASAKLLLGLNRIPAGTVMRPMGLVGVLVLCSAAALLVALPLSVIGFVHGCRAGARRALAAGAAGALLSLAAGFGVFPLFNYLVAAGGIILGD